MPRTNSSLPLPVRALGLLALFVLTTSLTGYILFSNVTKTSFHGDEPGWISEGFYYVDLLIKRDFDREKWLNRKARGWGAFNLPLGKYIIGAPITIYSSRHWDGKKYYGFYQWNGGGYKEQKRKGNVPPDEILFTARRVTAFFGALTVGIVFILGYLTYNVWAGVIASFLLMFNGLFVETSTRAMIDIFYNFFMILFCIVAVWFLKSSTRWRRIFSSALFGVVVGLACSVKLTGIIIGAILFGLLSVYKMYVENKSRSDAANWVLVAMISSLVVIYALNPLFWISFGKIDAGALIKESRPLYKEVVREGIRKDEMYARYPQFANITKPFDFFNMFFRWKNNNKWQTIWNKGKMWKQSKAIEFNSDFLFKHATIWFQWIFFFLGFTIFTVKIIKSIRQSKVSPLSVTLFFFLVNYIFLFSTLGVNWGRWYMAIIISGDIIAAVGIYEAAIWTGRKIVRRPA
ncbi:MAG TPA: phospholipid carrier-dependent glycosyltransferase [Nitrospirae bacterium]|nr:phospholipid carrier-dependent glycosyltransferase [Nitrospirota bacterium]